MDSVLNTVTITPIYAALLGLVLLVLSGRVIVAVRAKGVMLGDGEDPNHLALIRGHANFIEYVPMCLILIGFAEAGGASNAWVHGLGLALLVARVVHPFGMSVEQKPQPARFVGTVLTLLVLLIASVLLLVQQM